MLVRERKVCRDHGGRGVQDLLAHLVHGGLDARAVVFCKGLHDNGPRVVKGLVEARHGALHLSQVGELPSPAAVDVGGQDPVPDLGEGGVLVADETVEGRAGALEHAQARYAAGEGDAALAGYPRLDVAGLLTVAVERVRVGLPVDGHAGPAVGDDVDVDGVDVGVLLQEVGAEDAGVELRGVDGVLLRLDVDGVLDGVGGHDHTIVGLSVTGGDVALKEAGDSHFRHGLRAGRSVPVDLEYTDILLAVAGRR